jgi:DNA-binding LacI/PurR family transcriptional regulator
MATLKDIATQANVSIMTVSRVIKNSGYVNKETRKRIEAVIEELNYRPNGIAQSLVLKKTNNVLIIVPDIENFFFAEMLKGSESVFRRYGINVLFANSDGLINTEKQLVELGLSHIVDGLILYVPRVEDAFLELICRYIPTVVIDRRIRSEKVPQVYLDNKSGAMKAIEYLVLQGHRKIGLIEGPENVLANLRRKEGYIAALQKNGIEINEKYIFEGDFSFEEGQDAFEYFSKLPDGPSAFFATNDVMALGFIQQAQEHGVSIPDDYSIIGFDNISTSRLITPQLTTVNHPKKDMGELAAYKLLKLLGIEVEIPDYVLTNDLVIRNSVKQWQLYR